jgi:MoaA/NifB/PqqE/SkfB family radical SAM enzyme
MALRGLLQDYWIDLSAKKASQLLRKWEDKTLYKFLSLVEKFVQDENQKLSLCEFKALFERNHPFADWIKRLATQLNPKVQERFIANIILRSFFTNRKKRKRFLKEHGFYPPTNIVIDVTARCNMKCQGCWAAKYAKVPDMDINLIERIVRECWDMGINFITITGGEPFIRKDLLDLYAKYPKVFFHIYTNGVLIDKNTAKRLGELGNVAPMISIEGFEETTDRRRGKGTFRKLMEVMDNLRQEGVFFGFSVTTTRFNVEEVTSDEFINLMIEKGCMNGWYFNFVPVGIDPNPELMPTPEQRNFSRKRIYKIRNSRPIFVVDFWNDGPSINGCMAGGRYYLHITVNGDVEPCVFVHFAVDNIKGKSLLDVLKSPFFKAIREQIPYDGNTLRACMIIDRPEVLRDHVKRHNAKPTHEGADTLITTIKDQLDEYARGIAEIYEKAWKEGDWIRIFSFDYMGEREEVLLRK